MTLAEVSDASQAVAAVAVVVSLAVLIRQNYEANILARDEAVRRQIEGIQNISRELFEAPGLADVWLRGTTDFEELSNVDRIKFLSFATYTFRIWEALHRQQLRGLLEDSVWSAHTKMLRDVQALSGLKRAWEIRKHVFSETFQRFYETNAMQGAALDIYATDSGSEKKSSGGQVK